MYTAIEGIRTSREGGTSMTPERMKIGSAGSNINGGTRSNTREGRQLGPSHETTSAAFYTRRPKRSRIYDAPTEIGIFWEGG